MDGSFDAFSVFDAPSDVDGPADVASPPDAALLPACLDGGDVAALLAEGFETLRTRLFLCAVDIFSVGDELNTANMLLCAVRRIGNPISTRCLTCWIQSELCAFDRCLFSCTDGPTPACLECRCPACELDFATCSGIDLVECRPWAP